MYTWQVNVVQMVGRRIPIVISDNHMQCKIENISSIIISAFLKFVIYHQFAAGKGHFGNFYVFMIRCWNLRNE